MDFSLIRQRDVNIHFSRLNVIESSPPKSVSLNRPQDLRRGQIRRGKDKDKDVQFVVNEAWPPPETFPKPYGEVVLEIIDCAAQVGRYTAPLRIVNELGPPEPRPPYDSRLCLIANYRAILSPRRDPYSKTLN